MSMPHVLGLDGGGSSTTAWVADATGRVVGRGSAGPSNVKSVGERAALVAIESAVRAAMNQADLDRVTITCAGIAGLDHPEDQGFVERWSRARQFTDRLILVNDAELVLAAGTSHGWGVAVISGTGSIAVGRSPDGQFARAGGWGHLFGDEGSGYGVAIAALRMVAQRHDGRSNLNHAVLSAVLTDALGAGDPADLVNIIYEPEFDRARIAMLAAQIVKAAPRDPLIAETLLRPAGRELAASVRAVANRLNVTIEPLPLAIAGGFLLSSQDVVDALLAELGPTHVTRVEEPVAGAIDLAIHALAEHQHATT